MSGIGPCGKESSGVSGIGSGKGDAAEISSSREVSGNMKEDLNIGTGPKASAPSLKLPPQVSRVILVSK